MLSHLNADKLFSFAKDHLSLCLCKPSDSPHLGSTELQTDSGMPPHVEQCGFKNNEEDLDVSTK